MFDAGLSLDDGGQRGIRHDGEPTGFANDGIGVNTLEFAISRLTNQLQSIAFDRSFCLQLNLETLSRRNQQLGLDQLMAFTDGFSIPGTNAACGRNDVDDSRVFWNKDRDISQFTAKDFVVQERA